MPESTIESLEERIAELERQIKQPESKRNRDWRRTIGMFSSSEVMKAIQEEGQRIREEDRQAGHRKPDHGEAG